MAVRLPDYTPSRRIYPWDKWADGSAWRAVMGEDFHCTIKGFRSALRAFADRNHQKVTANARWRERNGEQIRVVEFRFSKPLPRKTRRGRSK